MPNRLLQRKPLERFLAESEGRTGARALKRVLGPLDLMLLGIGAIIGTGIFVLTGVAAVDHAGPGVIASFAIAGVVCAAAGLCYAEFATLFPISGSAYSYAYATLGELLAWIIGWDLVLEYALAASAVAVGWSGYFGNLLAGVGLAIPPALAGSPGSAEGALLNLPAVVILALVTALLVIGIRESARANAVIVAVKVLRGGIRDRGWHRPRPARELAALRAVRLERHHGGRGHGLLRVHRLRRGHHRGRGGAPPGARHVGRHPGLARRLHAALSDGVGGGDRHVAARRNRSRRPRRRRVQPHRARFRGGAHLGRRDRGSEQRAGGDAARSVARLLRDVARRTSAADLQSGAPALSYAPFVHDRRRRRGRRPSRPSCRSRSWSSS